MTEVLSHLKAVCGAVIDEHHRVPGSRSPGQISGMRSFLPVKNGCKSGASSSSTSSEFHGLKLVVEQSVPKSQNSKFYSPKMSLAIGKAKKWWEKGLQPNMKEITSAQDLVFSLLGAGDKLVVVDFFSPGCGGCKALYPKICQLAEMNPDVQFLQVNYKEHKSMCYSLNVHVLPFFRFYRGAAGRLCSFSCTNATIKKFKDALAKHNTERCSLGSAKGLEEELLALAANKDLGFPYVVKPRPEAPESAPLPQETFTGSESAEVAKKMLLPLSLSISKSSQDAEKSMVASGSWKNIPSTMSYSC